MSSMELVSACAGRISVVIVPNVFSFFSSAAFRDYNCVVLEDLLLVGSAALVFRRLRLAAFLDIKKREIYNRVRFEYLQRILNEYMVNTSRPVVLIATDPSDVDLIECDDVTIVELPDSVMRQMSLDIYGEPLMLPTEYTCVKSLLADNDVMRLHVTDFSHLPHKLLRQWPQLMADRVMEKPIESNFGMVCEVVRQMNLSPVWLEAESSLIYNMGACPVRAECEYLHAIKIEWRDAVLRVLGRAPEISRVFKLPWFVAKVSAVPSLCYRVATSGEMVVAMTGGSLSTFVRSNLHSYFNRTELIGTWVGAMLYDPAIAATVDSVSASDSAVRVLDVVEVPDTSTAVRVPEKYKWAYAACRDVIFVPEDFDGTLEASCDWCIKRRWDPVLPLVRVFSMPKDSASLTEIVGFVWRMHNLPNLCEVVVSVVSVWLTKGPGYLTDADMEIIGLLPGLGYFHWVPIDKRYDMFFQLGVFPELPYMAKVLYAQVWCDEYVQSAIRDAMTSTLLLANQPSDVTLWHRLNEVTVQADINMYPPGWCYLIMVPQKFRAVAMRKHGPFPKLGALIKDIRSYGGESAFENVRLSLTGREDYNGNPVLHAAFEHGVSVVTMLESIPLVRDSKGRLVPLLDCAVGAPATELESAECVAVAWKTGAIISITTIVVLILVWLGFVIHGRCVGGRKAAPTYLGRR